MPAEAVFRTHEPGFLVNQKPLDRGLCCAMPLLPLRYAPEGSEALLLFELNERPCPYGSQTAGRVQAMIASGGLHAALLAAAITMMPDPVPSSGERGGLPDVMAVMLVGEVEILAREEGMRSTVTSMVPSDPGSIFSIVTPDLVVTVPIPDLPHIPVTSDFVPQVAPPDAPGPEAREVPRDPVVEPVAKSQPLVKTAAPATPSAKKEKPANHQKNFSRVGEAKLRNAKGTNGDGLANATQSASRRGGTGGAASLGGTALSAAYSARLRALIERQKMYPEQAQERGQMGRTTVTLVVARDGRLEAVQLVQGSGHALLDAATLAAIRRAQPFPAMPDGAPPTASFTLALSYALN